MKKQKVIALILFGLFTSLSVTAFAAQSITDRIVIDDDDIPAAIEAGDLFGYQIEPIGDLDSDSVIDLAVIKFSDDSGETDAGSVLIMFMNSDGSVKGTNEIIMDDSVGNLAGCLAAGSVNRSDQSLEQLAFVGDLDGDGEPTLALGASSNDHPNLATGEDSGAIYMLELKIDGTVDNCVRIIPGESNFNPDDSVYNEIAQGNAALGWPLIATDLNGDGRNELIAGADSENDSYTNLWVLFLTTTGTVASHPATPIKGETDIGIALDNYIDDGITIDGGTKIAVSVQKEGVGGEGSVFIIDVTTAGAFVSSTEITGDSLGQGITANDAFGSGMAPLGDMDNDGVNDILVGNELGDDTNQDSGEAYILFMNSDDTVKESQKISNESENTRTGSTPFGNTDLFGHGMAVWKVSGGTAYVAISDTQSDVGGLSAGAIHIFSITKASSPSSSGGSSYDFKTRPTFGLDHNTFLPLVDNGLIINDKPFTVIDNFWTPIPMQNLTIGEVQTFTATTYAPKTLHVMEFLFGIPEVGEWGDAESSVAIELNYQGEIIGVETKNVDDTIADFSVLNYASSMVECTVSDSDSKCNRVSVQFSFNEAPIGKVLALQAIDYKNRNSILYFNDGIDLQGQSLNPPIEKQIMSEIKYKGMQTIQRIDKVNDIWVTLDEKEPILTYQQNSFGTFIPIEWREIESIHDQPTDTMDRYHSEFSKFVELEQMRAQKIIDEINGLH